mmetsp:Transcript_26428/g.65413  ORF Transcript_26428/g.65413 Transcript_26428/m.65413 type:complete len:204 (-) Transcript_26428:21-632(-)
MTGEAWWSASPRASSPYESWKTLSPSHRCDGPVRRRSRRWRSGRKSRSSSRGSWRCKRCRCSCRWRIGLGCGTSRRSWSSGASRSRCPGSTSSSLSSWTKCSGCTAKRCIKARKCSARRCGRTPSSLGMWNGCVCKRGPRRLTLRTQRCSARGRLSMSCTTCWPSESSSAPESHNASRRGFTGSGSACSATGCSRSRTRCTRL